MREKTLIPPVPKEYRYFSGQEKIERTEKYYKKVGELYLKIEEAEEEYREKINALLETDPDTKKILALLNKDEGRVLCHGISEFALLRRICQIGQLEEEFDEPCVMQNIHNLKDVTNWYQKCIFLIRRFEFNWEEESELLDYIKHEKLSYIWLSELVCENEIVQKIQTGCRITEYLYRNDCPREAALFIMKLEQKLPYSDRKVMYFAMTLLDMGESQLAYEVLMKHRNPDAEIKELQSMLEEKV